MWQVTGCQHSLVQPPNKDYSPPTIPALSLKGFSRWEALEILLGPEEHVPFIQYAVRNWSLKHPVTGEAFPADLPVSVFPAQADTDVDKWHKSCAAQLWQEASTEERAEECGREQQQQQQRGRGSSPEKQEPKFTYVHVKPPSYPSPPPPTSRGEHVRPGQGGRPLYTHVPRHGSGPHARQERPQERPRESPSGMHDGRRRSFSDIPSPTAPQEPAYPYKAAPYIDPTRRPTHQQQRRHSQPRHFSSESSEDEHLSATRKPRHRQQQGSPPTPPYNRRPPTASSQQSSSATARTQRSDIRDNNGGLKRHVGNSPRGSIRDKLSEKVSNIFPSSRPAERTDSRHSSYNAAPARPRGARAPAPPRAAHVDSDIEDTESSDSASSEDESPRRRPALRSREERERDHYRDRGRPYVLDRELDDDIESPAARRTRQHLRRPNTARRTSSHADVDRRREGPAWDPRDKERERLRDERKRYERRSPDHDRRSPSPLTGVSGRRYPEAAAY